MTPTSDVSSSAPDRQTATARAALGTLVVRVVLPAILIAIAVLQIRNGTSAILPPWLDNLLGRGDVDRALAARVVVGLELTVAGILLLVGAWARPLAQLTLVLIAFSALASTSARFGVDGLPWGHILIALASGLLFLLVRWAAPTRVGAASGSFVWRGLGVMAAAVIGFAVAGRSGFVVAQVPDMVVRGGSAFELDEGSWTGRLITETPIKNHLPILTALTIEGTSLIVFYNARCGRCHEVFLELFERGVYDDETFPGQVPMDRVIAIEVPPADGALVLESEYDDEDIECPDCERLALPSGPIWLIDQPTMVLVVDGRVRCVSSGDVSDCLEIDLDAEPDRPVGPDDA